MQGGDGHAPRLFGGAVAAGHGQRAEVAEALAVRAVEVEQFAAPGTTIRTEADAIECQADNRLVDAMFGADRGDMGVMMANCDGRNAELFGQAQGEMGRREIGMQVVGDQLGPDIEDGQQMLDRFLKKADGRRIVEAADVLREEGFAALHDADRVLQVAAQRQTRSGRRRPTQSAPARSRGPGG